MTIFMKGPVVLFVVVDVHVPVYVSAMVARRLFSMMALKLGHQ